jgi:cell growth-regulating nucleolar protein
LKLITIIFKPAATTPVKKPESKKQAAPSKPISIVDELNEKKRKSEAAIEETKPKKVKALTTWSSTELSKDESKNLELAVKEVLKNGVSLICVSMKNESLN